MPSQTLRIVIASPSDVKAERDILERVVKELNDGVCAVCDVRLDVNRWETDAAPGFHEHGPQGVIDSWLRVDKCDLLIGVFWRRFGTPVRDAQSGTEHEFNVAYESWRRTGRPQVMVYFNQSPYMPQSTSETEQQGRVLAFRERFPDDGLWWKYKGRVEFERTLRSHLTRFVLYRSTPEGRGAVDTLATQVARGSNDGLGSEPRDKRKLLRLIWIVDCSGSMNGGKIRSVNTAMRTMIAELRGAMQKNFAPQDIDTSMLVQVLAFGNGARWHTHTPTPFEAFEWHDLTADGATDAGTALGMIADELSTMPVRALPPVLVLLLNGAPTDDFSEGVRRLNEQPWGKRSVRVGMAVGDEADLAALREFMGSSDREPLTMRTSDQLIQHVRWVSSSVAGSMTRASRASLPQPPMVETGDVDAW